jgi:hypothetical protein
MLQGTYVAYQLTASPLLERKTLHRCRDITYVNLNFAKVDVASSSLVTRSNLPRVSVAQNSRNTLA